MSKEGINGNYKLGIINFKWRCKDGKFEWIVQERLKIIYMQESIIFGV